MNKKKEEIATTLNRFTMPHTKKSDWNEKQSRIRRRRRSWSLYKPNNCCCITQNLLSLSLPPPLSLLFLVAVVCRALFLLASRKRLDKPVFCVLFFFCYSLFVLLLLLLGYFNVLSVSCSYQWTILTRNCSFLPILIRIGTIHILSKIHFEIYFI